MLFAYVPALQLPPVILRPGWPHGHGRKTRCGFPLQDPGGDSAGFDAFSLGRVKPAAYNPEAQLVFKDAVHWGVGRLADSL